MNNSIDGTAPLLDIVLYPHRSLSPRGFAILMAGIIGAMMLVATYFTVLGAWLVLPFFGIEIGLIYFAFRLNSRDARNFETVRLTEDSLTVEQVRPSGRRRQHRFQPPHWLRVNLAQMPDGNNKLILASHGKSLVIGHFLSADERREVANNLHTALKRLVAAAPTQRLDGQT